MDVAGLEPAGLCQRTGALDDVLELANIARPMMAQEKVRGFWRNGSDRPSRLAAEFSEKQIRQVGDVFYVFAQWRYVNRNHVQPVVEVFAKRALLESGAQIAVGGCNQPHVHFNGSGAAEALEFAFLQHAQKFHLRGRRHVPDLIEEQSSFVGQLELAGLAAAGSSEGALLITEEFALQQVLRDGGAIDLDEWAGGAAGLFMNHARDQILAHAAFAAQQNS